MRRRTSLVLTVLVGFFAAGCGDDPEPIDGGLADTTSLDTLLADTAGRDTAGSDTSAGDGATSDSGTSDGSGEDGTASDSGSPDAMSDAPNLDGGTVDVVVDGGSGMCDWDAFLSGRPGMGRVPLMVGSLCDDVFVCVESRAQAVAVMRAGPNFVCSMGEAPPCAGLGCTYRNPGGPSSLDAEELAEICAVTLVEPRPEMVCQIYL